MRTKLYHIRKCIPKYNTNFGYLLPLIKMNIEFFLSIEEIIDLFDTSSIEKTKERIKILFTENAEFLTERMFSKNEIFYRGRVGFNNEKGAIDDCDINVTFP